MIFNFFKPVETVICRGEELYLRRMESRDIKLISGWFRNIDIMTHAFGIDAPPEYIKKISDDYIKEVAQTPSNSFIISLNSGRPIGMIRFSMRSLSKKYAILGILLGENKNLGKGYGTKALNLVLEYFFKEKNLSYIELDTAPFNKRAQSCFEKCGFEFVGEIKEVDYSTGKTIIKNLMRLQRERFYSLYRAANFGKEELNG